MNRCWKLLLPLVMGGVLGVNCLFADEEPPVASLARNGVLTFTCPEPDRSYRVEWASTPAGPWSSSWEDLCRIEPGAEVSVTVAVPMFYRVKSPAVEQTIELVPAADARALIEANAGDPKFTILDVRTAGEFNGGHIIGAVNLDRYGPMFGEILALLERDRVYLVNCASGGRSAATVATMRTLGFEEVYDLGGGFGAFSGILENADLIE